MPARSSPDTSADRSASVTRVRRLAGRANDGRLGCASAAVINRPFDHQ
jgi:hypothetical protein